MTNSDHSDVLVKLEVVSRYDDEKTNQTLVMLASKVGHDSAAEKERFDLSGTLVVAEYELEHTWKF